MLGNGVKAAVGLAQAAVDALVLVDDVGALDGSGDGAHRAVPGAQGAAPALVGIDLKVGADCPRAHRAESFR